jgi:hypothetical protein
MNGWQRLWVLASIVWLVPAVPVSISVWPADREDFKRLSATEIIDGRNGAMRPLVPVGGVMPPEGFITDPPPGGPWVFAPTAATSLREIVAHHDTTVKERMLLIALLVTPPVLVYLFGVGVAWVRRGF